MTHYALMFGWLFGVSSMGRLPFHLHVYMLAMISLGLLLAMLCLYLRASRNYRQKLRWSGHSLHLCGCFMLMLIFGYSYADHALEQHLMLRSHDAKHAEAIIYIDQIAENAQYHPQRWQHQVWVLKPNQAPIRWRLSYFQLHTADLESVFEPQPQSQPPQSQSARQPPSQLQVDQTQKQQPKHKVEQSLDPKPEQFQNALQLGHYYRVHGAVRAAHAYAVEGAFDLERWFVQQHLMGSMQVQRYQQLSDAEVDALGLKAHRLAQQGLWSSLGRSIQNLRLSIRAKIISLNYAEQGLMLALLTGDRSLLDRNKQDQFQRLGIAHLLAISGPHVLIMAIMFSYFLVLVINRCCPTLYLRCSRPLLLIFPLLSCVIFYSALVGFEIPAQRTLITVALLSLSQLLHIAVRPMKLVLFSACIMLLWDPLSILSAAFYLSYVACLVMLLLYQQFQYDRPKEELQTVYARSKKIVLTFAHLQFKLLIALLPITLLIFQKVSYWALLSNFIAVPLISVMIVPVLILAALSTNYVPILADALYGLAQQLLSFLTLVLQLIDGLPWSEPQWWALTTLQWCLLTLAVLLWMLPKAVLPRYWIVVPLSCAVFYQPLQQFELEVLDVGQGQAIYMQSTTQRWMIDVGGNPREQQDAKVASKQISTQSTPPQGQRFADQVLLPFLMYKGVKRLDQVILSHLDADHSGSFADLSKVVQIKTVFANESNAEMAEQNFKYCYAGQQWQDAHIKVEILSPRLDQLETAAQRRNERSCVVYLTVGGNQQTQHFLIMGDAGWETEFELMRRYPKLKVDVLVLGYHGSRHSSAYDFLQHYRPQYAVASVGQDNPYGHPSVQVLRRLKQLKIPLLGTHQMGSIHFRVDAAGHIAYWGQRQQRLWWRSALQ